MSESDQSLQAKSFKNWMRIPADQREACLRKLSDAVAPADRDRLRQHFKEHGDFRGFGGGGFHILGGGMALRNVLRGALLDQDLPDVQYPDGKSYKNWDDFYTGALQDFVQY